MCKKCRHYLHVNLSYPHNGSRLCPNVDYPLHHFILQKASRGSTYAFECSSQECGASAVFSYQPPCISPSDLELLTHPTYLKRRYEAAVQKDTSRSGFVLGTPVSTLWKLRRYIRDSFKPDSAGKKIPAENKRFLESFGSDCDELFRRLGFNYVEDSEHEGSWELPQVSDAAGSQQASFLENWDMELQALLDFFAARDGDLNPAPEYEWYSARSDFERILSAQSCKRKKLRLRPANNHYTDSMVPDTKTPQSRRDDGASAQDHP